MITNDDIRSVYNLLQRTASQNPDVSFATALASTAFITDDADMQNIIQKGTSSILNSEILKLQKRIELADSAVSSSSDKMKFQQLLSQFVQPNYYSSTSKVYFFSKCLELADDLSLTASQVAKTTAASISSMQPPPQPPITSNNNGQSLAKVAESKGNYHIMEDVSSERNKRNIVEVDGDLDQNAANAKRNPFSSAKDKFQHDVSAIIIIHSDAVVL